MAPHIFVNTMKQNIFFTFQKKKSKEGSSATRELSPVSIEPPMLEQLVDIAESTCGIKPLKTESNSEEVEITEEADTSNLSIEIIEDTVTYSKQIIETNVVNQESIAQSSSSADPTVHINETPQITKIDVQSNTSTKEVPSSSVEGSYKELSKQPERIAIPNEVREVGEDREYELVHPDAYLTMEKEIQDTPFEHVGEDVMPSAPCFEVIPEPEQYEAVVIERKPKVKCMSLDDAIKLCGGKEMEEVRAMSAREEEIVEAGPLSGPEHPLVDLLSTFRFVLKDMF